MVAEIYRWFTEGFDTADLKDAKALLHELMARSLAMAGANTSMRTSRRKAHGPLEGTAKRKHALLEARS